MPLPGPPLPSPGLLPGGNGPFTEQMLASLAPWLAHDPGGHFRNLAVAKAQMAEQVFAIVQDVGSPDDPANFVAGWSVLLDPDNCPASFIPYGAQFVGVTIPPGTPEAEARAIWKAEGGFQRGTPAAIIAAAKRFLTGTQSLILLERTGTPPPGGLNPNGTPWSAVYNFQLIVRPTELASAAALQAAVDAVRPAGVTWQLIQTAGWLLFQMEGAYATNSALEAAFTTINGLEGDQVGH